MLKQFAPSVLMPPSPKNRAWIASAMEMTRIAPDGPSTMAEMVTPNAWPVVPPGSGRLNIMTTNENAAKTEISGTTRLKRGKDRDQRDHATEQHAFQSHQRGVPPCDRSGIQHRAGGWTQVAVRYMHGEVRLRSAYLILTYSGLVLAAKARRG